MEEGHGALKGQNGKRQRVKKKKLIEARKLIKAGMGTAAANEDGKDDGTSFEVVEQDRPMPVMDKRQYD